MERDEILAIYEAGPEVSLPVTISMRITLEKFLVEIVNVNQLTIQRSY